MREGNPLKRCPVCKNDAKDAGERDYGDKKRIDCPRCGPFEVSGTALAMMDGRLGDDELARARLSHALRQEPKREGEWFMITSTNIDALVASPLPDIDHQIRNLLLWLSSRLGDDHLGSIHVENQEYLAGMIGAVDAQRVKRLLKHAQSEQLIEIIDETQLVLTKKGWDQLNEKEEQPEAPPQRLVKANLNRPATSPKW